MMNWRFKAAAALSLALAGPAANAETAPQACVPIPGWEQVLAREELRWIVIGELHGTAETPAIFADAVCLAAQERRVVVALEVPSTDQPAIDAWLASDGGPAARAAFLKALLWNMPMKDGRSSEAFLALFDRLRQMHAAGAVAGVVAFQDNSPADDPSGDQGPYEKRLAAIVRDAAVPDGMVLVLVGNGHARKSEVIPGASDRKPFRPMAMHLPPETTLTLYAIGNGSGSAWNCQADGCGVHDNSGPPEPMDRGVELGPVMDGAYDGMLWLGVPTTASLPQPVP